MPKVRDKGLKRKSDGNNEGLTKSKRITPLLLRERLESLSVVDSLRKSWLSNKPLITDLMPVFTTMEPQAMTLMMHAPVTLCPPQIPPQSPESKPLARDGVILSTEPFKHCIVQDFIADKEDLCELKKELLTLTLNEKLNDLYQFSQSEDLSTVNKPMVNSLEEFLQNKCKPWLENVTGIKLNEKVSATCSSYKHTDHLLCHDDKCEDRIIAFILYLTENWTSECGGALELFDTDASGQPKDIVKSIVPAFNSFLFFEVADNSFHQVAEVTSPDSNRLSVNGWFHGTRLNITSKEAISSLPTKAGMSFILPQDEGEEYLRHINPMFLNSDIQKQIREEFEESSEILLPEFLQEDIFKKLCESFHNKDITWNILGPPNTRKYETATEVSLPAAVRNVEHLFQSKGFFSLLKNLTNLDLAPTSEDNCKNDSSNPCCVREVQRWQKGFYTLVHDNTCNEFALDVTLYCNVKSDKLLGGYTSYIARDADEELLTVEPQDNALALTFKDKDTLRFVKYISTCNPDELSYHVLQYIYKESTQESEERNNL